MAFQIAQVFFITVVVFYCCAAETTAANEPFVADDRHGKFFAALVTKTVTSTTVSTTVVPTTVNPTCFTSQRNITACAARRRRGLNYEERPIFIQILPNGIIVPTQVQIQVIKPTATPGSEPKSLPSSVVALESSNSQADSLELAEAEADAAERLLLATKTVFVTTVVTEPKVSLSTVTGKETATVSLANCKPAGVNFTPAC